VELPAEAAARRGELAAGARADRLPIALTNAGLTAGFDKSDPADPCLVCSAARVWRSPCLTAEWVSSRIEKCQRAREWWEDMPCKCELESWARCAC
jgi:hypothetical protein